MRKVRVPETWYYDSSWHTEPEAEVTVASGYDYEGEYLTANQCRNLAVELMQAAADLDRLAGYARRGDRLTNYSPRRHRTPFVPAQWKLEVGLPLSFGDKMNLTLQHHLNVQSYGMGLGLFHALADDKPQRKVKARRN